MTSARPSPLHLDPPVSTYVAVARGRAASREAGDVPATVHEHPAQSSADPSGSGRSALELAFGRADKDRLDTTAVHLRLALPHVRAALRQLRDSCRAHVDARSADADADADASDVATEVSALASQLMEMDAEALRACCKPVVEHARRLLGVTGRRSTERTQLVTLLFSLSRFLPLVASLDPDPDPEPVENRPRDAATDASSPDERRPTASLSLAAHDAAVRERARATALLDAAVAAAAADPPAPGPTPPAAADRVAGVVAGLRAYAAAVSAWQAALVENELRAEGIAGVDVAGRRVPAPRFSSAGFARVRRGSSTRARPRPAAPRRRVSGRLRAGRASRAACRYRSTPSWRRRATRTATSSSTNPNRRRRRGPWGRVRPRWILFVFVEPRRRRPVRWRRRRSSDARGRSIRRTSPRRRRARAPRLARGRSRRRVP